MKNFVSVGTNAARFQDLSLNPQKLAGMCAKLKCCLNYEVDNYVEAGKKMPSKEVILQTLDSDYYLFKIDILAGLCTYSTDKNIAANLETITAERARLIIEMNKRGEKPAELDEEGKNEPEKPIDLLAETDVSRFDKAKKKKKKPAQQNRPRQPRNEQHPNMTTANSEESNDGQLEQQVQNVNSQTRQHTKKGKGKYNSPRNRRQQGQPNQDNKKQ